MSAAKNPYVVDVSPIALFMPKAANPTLDTVKKADEVKQNDEGKNAPVQLQGRVTKRGFQAGDRRRSAHAVANGLLALAAIAAQTASVTSAVVAEPPRSRVCSFSFAVTSR